MRRGLVVAALLGGLVLAATLSGCTTDGVRERAREGAEPAASDSGARGSAGAGQSRQPRSVGAVDAAVPAADPDRQVVRTAELAVRVRDIAGAAGRAREAASGLGGLVASEDVVTDGARREAVLTLRVPADRLGVLLDRLAGLGTVVSRHQEATDVTEQVVDLRSRLDSQRRSVARVRALLDRARTVGEVVSVEGELAKREADLEALEARLRVLSGQVELASVTVRLTPPPPAEPADAPGFLAGLRAGWRALTGAFVVLATALGAALPFLALLAVLAGAAWRVRAAARVRRSRATSAPAGPEAAGPEAGATR
jgi:hypothetical protein